ncbi:MAG: metallophosphoesterase family protein [Chitinophagaceae bacterium]|nr:MAG: metallophosphoesterase family protein [Chitinophagaceae bacterium]
MKIKLIAILMFFLILPFAGWAQDNISITHGPYLQAMTDTSVTIVWTTNKPSTAWVELAPDDQSHFYQKERNKFFDASNGLKNIDTVHRVTLNHLKPATSYRYRIFSQEVLSHVWVNVQYGKTASSAVYQKKPLNFTTNKRSGDISFVVVNDIHERSSVLKQLLSHVDFTATDFVVFNGDMINNSTSQDQIFKGFMDTAVSVFASEKPMYYARGNHETRAPFASRFAAYFPTNNHQLYYMFQQGDACFIVLDGGEDKPDSDIEYSGITDMDAYRSEQAIWLQKAVNSEVLRKAKYKIAICHIPAVKGWHGNEEIMSKWVPILNKAGIQVMLSGHEHRHRIVPPNKQAQFPVIINSNNNLLKANLSNGVARFSVYDASGKLVEETSISSKK